MSEVRTHHRARQFDAPVTSKGQVTIPVEIRRRLGLDAPGRITFVVSEDGEVTLRPARFPTLESMRGAAGLPRPLSWDEMRAIGWEDAVAPAPAGPK